MYAVESRHIYQTEEQVAHFLSHLLFIHYFDFRLEFVSLLAEFLPDITSVLPVETDICRLFLNAVCLYQGW